MFNYRRLSEDSAVNKRILELTKNSSLWMNSYSGRLFENMAGSEHIRVDDEFIDRTVPGEYCFIEGTPVAQHAPEIGRIILFKWNRDYPQDVSFDIDVNAPEWKLVKTEDFAGSSHERITMEEYVQI